MDKRSVREKLRSLAASSGDDDHPRGAGWNSAAENAARHRDIEEPVDVNWCRPNLTEDEDEICEEVSVAVRPGAGVSFRQPVGSVCHIGRGHGRAPSSEYINWWCRVLKGRGGRQLPEAFRAEEWDMDTWSYPRSLWGRRGYCWLPRNHTCIHIVEEHFPGVCGPDGIWVQRDWHVRYLPDLYAPSTMSLDDVGRVRNYTRIQPRASYNRDVEGRGATSASNPDEYWD